MFPPGDRREPPADTLCPPAAQRKHAKRACGNNNRTSNVGNISSSCIMRKSLRTYEL